MVWTIIAHGIVYVKCKTLYKTKLMVLNCRLLPPRSSVRQCCMCGGAVDGGNVICQCVSIAAMSMTTHIKPLHDSLSRPFKGLLW